MFSLSGCATETPPWLKSPTGAFCVDQINVECLRTFAQQQLQVERDKSVAPIAPPASQGAGPEAGDSVAIETESTVTEAASKSSSSTLASPTVSDQSMRLIFALGIMGGEWQGAPLTESEKTAYVSGGVLYVAEGIALDQQIHGALAITERHWSLAALSALVITQGHRMHDDQLNLALNRLYAGDQSMYQLSLIVKLPKLLRIGDYDRAGALRDSLMASKISATHALSMMPYVTGCYAMLGLKDDAKAFVRSWDKSGNALTMDDRKLLAMAMYAADHTYPPLQSFYDYESDEARLQAHLTLVTIALQAGDVKLARQGLFDAVRFIQKSAVKVDRSQALYQIMVLTPGLI